MSFSLLGEGEGEREVGVTICFPYPSSDPLHGNKRSNPESGVFDVATFLLCWLTFSSYFL